MTLPHLQHDLSDNAVRGAVLSTLIDAVVTEPVKEKLTAWSPDARHEQSLDDQAGPEIQWKLNNDLRVMSQYLRVLRDASKSHFFLKGEPVTCVEGLEWFSQLTQLHAGTPQDYLADAHAFVSECKARGGYPSLGHAAFDAHRAIRRPDLQLTQYLVHQHFPGPFKNYELRVCCYMLADPSLSHERWLHEFPRWREKGLYYPLALAAVYMPTLAHWVPIQVHHTRVAAALEDCLQALRNPAADHAQPLGDLAAAWADDQTGTAHVFSGILDRLAVLMGVKSNGPNFVLSEALQAFSEKIPTYDFDEGQSLHASNYEAWHTVKQLIENAFPPSVLTLPLVKPKRDTWGYQNLTLQIQPTGGAPVVAFAERTLEHVSPSRVAHHLAHTYSPPHIKECMLHQTSHRIQDVLWRLGEIMTSHHVAKCMLHPHNDLGAPLGMHINDILGSMGKPGWDEEHRDLCMAKMQDLDHQMPRSTLHFLPSTSQILLWRLDIPPKAIIYVGSDADVDPYSESFHHLQKIMVNSKVPHKAVGGISRVVGGGGEECARQALRDYARISLATNPANTTLVTKAETESELGEKIKHTMPVTTTTLAESVASLTLTRPTNLTHCKVGQSCAWKEDGIDPRYAEKQVADNGFRYRDWTAIHVGRNGTQQSRLAAHLVQYDQVYTTVMPWYVNQTLAGWVHVTSSLCPESRTLHGDTLRQAVESRFMHDTRMLPAENNERVSRSNCEIYKDASGTIGIAYCADNCSHIHFMCFECKSQQ